MILVRAIHYQIQSIAKCCCAEGCDAQRFAGRYQFLVFNVGRDLEVTWWLSKN